MKKFDWNQFNTIFFQFSVFTLQNEYQNYINEIKHIN